MQENFKKTAPPAKLSFQFNTIKKEKYSLWKLTKKLEQQQQYIDLIRKEDVDWPRDNKEKALCFAQHLQKAFNLYYTPITGHEHRKINPDKVTGFVQIMGRALKELQEKSYKCLTKLTHSMIGLRIILIP